MLGQFEECKTKWRPRNSEWKYYKHHMGRSEKNSAQCYLVEMDVTITATFWLCIFMMYIYAAYSCVLEERNAALWPRIGLWEGEEGTWRRNRIVQLVDRLGPSTGYDSALESQHQLCAMSPGTEKNEMRKKKSENMLYNKSLKLVFVSTLG